MNADEHKRFSTSTILYFLRTTSTDKELLDNLPTTTPVMDRFNLSDRRNVSAMITSEAWFVPVDILMIICLVLTILLAMLFLFIIAIDRTCHTLSIFLMGNTCLAQLFNACNTLAMTIFTLQNDRKQIHYQDPLCMLRGHLTNVSYGAVYHSFLLQALYRYVSVVYPAGHFWQARQTYAYLVLFTWLFSSTHCSWFWLHGDMVYDADNQLCQLPLRLTAAAVYNEMSVFFGPVAMIGCFYLKLVLYVKTMSKRVTLANTLARARRELKMIQRTVILVGMILASGFPYAVFVHIGYFTTPPKYHFRIAYIFLDVTLPFVMLVLFHFTDPLKVSVKKLICSKPMAVIRGQGRTQYSAVASESNRTSS